MLATYPFPVQFPSIGIEAVKLQTPLPYSRTSAPCINKRVNTQTAHHHTKLPSSPPSIQGTQPPGPDTETALLTWAGPPTGKLVKQFLASVTLVRLLSADSRPSGKRATLLPSMLYWSMWTHLDSDLGISVRRLYLAEWGGGAVRGGAVIGGAVRGSSFTESTCFRDQHYN